MSFSEDKPVKRWLTGTSGSRKFESTGADVITPLEDPGKGRKAHPHRKPDLASKQYELTCHLQWSTSIAPNTATHITCSVRANIKWRFWGPRQGSRMLVRWGPSPKKLGALARGFLLPFLWPVDPSEQPEDPSAHKFYEVMPLKLQQNKPLLHPQFRSVSDFSFPFPNSKKKTFSRHQKPSLPNVDRPLTGKHGYHRILCGGKRLVADSVSTKFFMQHQRDLGKWPKMGHLG